MSRLPLEQMMASLRPPAVSSSKFGTIAGVVWVVIAVVIAEVSVSDAAVRLGQAGDVGHLLGRLLGEQGEQRLGRDTGEGGHSTDGRGLALGLVVLAQE